MIKKGSVSIYVSLKLLQGKNKHSVKVKVYHSPSYFIKSVKAKFYIYIYLSGHISRELYTCDLIHGQARCMEIQF